MMPLIFLPKLLIAGGVSFLGTLQLPPVTPLDNHTLAGEKIPAVQVVTRDQWGTPILPDNKGGYSLIAPINKKLILQSLWIPPVSGTRPVVEVPAPLVAPVTPVAAPPVTPAAPTGVPSAAKP